MVKMAFMLQLNGNIDGSLTNGLFLFYPSSLLRLSNFEQVCLVARLLKKVMRLTEELTSEKRLDTTGG